MLFWAVRYNMYVYRFAASYETQKQTFAITLNAQYSYIMSADVIIPLSVNPVRLVIDSPGTMRVGALLISLK